jgi:hypothetical protein
MDQLFLWQSIFGDAKLEDLNGQKEITLLPDIQFQRQVRPRCDLVACPKDTFSTFATTPSNHLVLENKSTSSIRASIYQHRFRPIRRSYTYLAHLDELGLLARGL